MQLYIPTLAPRSTYSVSGLLDRVRGDLGYRNSNLITDQDIINWANEASDRIAYQTHWFLTSAYVDSVSGVQDYALPASPRCINIHEIRYNSNRLAVTSPEQLYQINYNWQRIGTGTPTRWYARGNSSFGLFVTPGSSVQSVIQVYYTACPPVTTAPLDLFYIPSGFDWLLITYAKLRASEKDAVGEGRPRIPGFLQDWNMGLQECRRQCSSTAEGDVFGMGEQAMYNQMASPRPVFSINQYATIAPSR